MNTRKKKDVKRLLELLGSDDIPPPASLSEAADLARKHGGNVEVRQGHRKENKCGKMCFSSAKMAKSAMRRRLNIGANTDRLRTYFCDVCTAWHLTSSFKS